jgi:hypothetical protein
MFNTLLKNWQESPQGGLSAEELSGVLSIEQKQSLLTWFKNGGGIGGAVPSLKELVDMASWARYGADTISDFPPHIRTNEIEKISKRFGLPPHKVVSLLTSVQMLLK